MMNQTQSIIVYRNPLEAAFWEGGYAFPMMVFIVLMFVFALILLKLQEVVFRYAKWSNRGNMYAYTSYAGLAFACVASFFATALILS